MNELEIFIKDIRDRINQIAEDSAQEKLIEKILSKADFDAHPKREIQRLKEYLDEKNIMYENHQ